ncbi:Aste57867_20004 [Aphanomyces stellatus]|uniref:Aste57867_20004 protein n=1 Tax=Aphanomyces stellatus TaxID=120398 RepID=A0A485LDV3_9STRA|nr:hypothetical protein As57867_019938 [Aphanomyces stellatus]VFT96701.1 Aste57867_20004 [Aphanomyces stellatus]
MEVERPRGKADVEPIPDGESPIQNTYCFWYMKKNSGKTESYEKSIKELGEFRTVQGFWRVYNHLIRPNDLPNTTDYHLFKAGIKPMWEDAANRRGGKWMIRIRKGIASRYWEDLVLAIVGEQFDVGNEICGAVMSIRYNEDIISLWNRNADNNEACYRIRDTMRKLLNLPQFVSLEYKRHDTSLNDNSSFRNTTVWRNGEKTRLNEDGTPMSPANTQPSTQQGDPQPPRSQGGESSSRRDQQQSSNSRNNGRDGGGRENGGRERSDGRSGSNNRGSNRRDNTSNRDRRDNSAAWTRDTTIREKKDRTSSFSRENSTTGDKDDEGWQTQN